MVDLVRAGRSPKDLAREFEPTAQSIGSWVAAAAKQEGRREKALLGLSAAEKGEKAHELVDGQIQQPTELFFARQKAHLSAEKENRSAQLFWQRFARKGKSDFASEYSLSDFVNALNLTLRRSRSLEYISIRRMGDVCGRHIGYGVRLRA